MAFISGCEGPGSRPEPGPRAVTSPTSSTVGVPPPGVGAKAWSADVSWNFWDFTSVGVPPYPDEPVTDWDIAQGQVKYGVVAAIGNVVVLPSQPARGASSSLLSLRFLNSKTGAPVADRQLPGRIFQGIRAATVGGTPVAEVRYINVAGDEVNALFDATGEQIWTSLGKQLGGLQPTSAGDSVGDMAGGGLFAGGFRLRFTPDPGTGTGSWNRGGVYDVLDVADHKVLTIPVNVSVPSADPAAGIRNSVSLAGGYAVVATPERIADPGATVMTRITVYDLAANGKEVATLSEPTVKPANGDITGQADAAIGGKLLLSWMGPTQPPAQREFHEGPYQDLFFAVVDTSTGRGTPPVDTGLAPSGIGPAFTDPSASTVVEYALQPSPGGGLPTPAMFAVDMADGTVSWRRHDVFQLLSAHGDILYGLQTSAKGQRQLIEVGAADGKTMTGGFTVAPLAFTADGTPVFVEATVARPKATPSQSGATPRGLVTSRPVLPSDPQVIEVWAPAPH